MNILGTQDVMMNARKIEDPIFREKAKEIVRAIGRIATGACPADLDNFVATVSAGVSTGGVRVRWNLANGHGFFIWNSDGETGEEESVVINFDGATDEGIRLNSMPSHRQTLIARSVCWKDFGH